MKKLVLGLMMAFAVIAARAMTSETDFEFSNGVITEYKGSGGDVEIPSVIGGQAVTSIGGGAFYDCSGLASVTIPESVTCIGANAFSRCGNMTNVTMASSVAFIGANAFWECASIKTVNISNLGSWCSCKFGTDASQPLAFGANLYVNGEQVEDLVVPAGVTDVGNWAFCGAHIKSVVVPASVKSLGRGAFDGQRYFLLPEEFGEGIVVYVVYGRDLAFRCGYTTDRLGGLPSVERFIFRGEPPTGLPQIFDECSWRKVQPQVEYNAAYSKKWWVATWVSGVKHAIPIVPEGQPMPFASPVVATVTVTNVVVNYVLNSIQPEFAKPALQDTGLVNIITEVKGGVIAVPSSWADNYPTFTTKFGADFTKALSMKTGKKDGAGNDMLVWQDYVAGTDPTKPEDKFTASITVVEGKVTISYTPELDDARKALRKYTTWGKRSLFDTDWTEVQEGCEPEYNFFKVSVEMR